MASPSEIPPEALLGGKFRLIHRIGRGGMGDVWVARNEATQAEVAVKTLARTERTPNHDARFRREARLAATISHRNVVRIFDLVDDATDGSLALVMELLRGGTLDACMRERGPMSTMHAIAVAAPILSALHHVHQKGIVHRDVKPANIFFAVEPDGHVIPKILDFGIAKLPAISSSLTVDGTVLGTPHYMAPEQIRGQEDLDGRSDMFSLGIVLYEMLTGERVFQRDSAAASLAAVLEHEVDPDPRIEPLVWVTLARALAKRPYERFASCGEFADALRRAVGASEEDLSRALQQLSPRSDAIPVNEAATTKGMTSLAPPPHAEPSVDSDVHTAVQPSGEPGGPPSVDPGIESSKRRTFARTVVAAGAAAVVAIVVTLAITRPSSTAASAADTSAAGSSVGSAAAISAATAAPATSSSARDEDAPPVTASAAVDLGDVAPPPTAATTTTSGEKPGGASRASSRPRVTSPHPHSGAKPASGHTKPIATSPGF